MTTAAIYSRYSTDNQTESSLSDQQRICNEFAAAHDWQVIENYSDAGISGATFGARPAFLRMREAAMAGKFDVLLVCDTTRLCRSQELAPLIDRLRYQGVRIIGCQDSFDSDTGTADMQAGLSGILSVEFRRMVRARTHAALESRAKQQRPTGGKTFGFDKAGAVIEAQAAVVREIFEAFANGQNCRSIAASLNARAVPSPGSTWKRTQRRCGGWLGSTIRVVLKNPRYTGRVQWNTSQWRKDPDSGQRKRIARPADQWITHTGPRIVSDDLWQRAQSRMSVIRADGNWAAPRGKVRYLLSGLLRCASCGSHYVICNHYEYSCSSYVNGRACDNHVRVNRVSLENDLIGPIHRDVLSPERVARMAVEMSRYYLEQLRARAQRAVEAPRELQELTARIERLRRRLREGDPDMTADEIQAALTMAEGKRAELEAQQPDAQAQARVLSILPRAAEELRRQVQLGLSGDARAAGKARVVLRAWFGGRIDLEREGQALYASYGEQPAALMQVVGFKALGNSGSGGRI